MQGLFEIKSSKNLKYFGLDLSDPPAREISAKTKKQAGFEFHHGRNSKPACLIAHRQLFPANPVTSPV